MSSLLIQPSYSKHYRKQHPPLLPPKNLAAQVWLLLNLAAAATSRHHDHVDLPLLAIAVGLGLCRRLLHAGFAVAHGIAVGINPVHARPSHPLSTTVDASVFVVFRVHSVWLYAARAERLADFARGLSMLWHGVGTGVYCLSHFLGLPQPCRAANRWRRILGLVAPHGHTAKLSALAACKPDHCGVFGMAHLATSGL